MSENAQGDFSFNARSFFVRPSPANPLTLTQGEKVHALQTFSYFPENHPSQTFPTPYLPGLISRRLPISNGNPPPETTARRENNNVKQRSKKNPCRPKGRQGRKSVGVRRFELPTSATRTQRAARLRYTPIVRAKLRLFIERQRIYSKIKKWGGAEPRFKGLLAAETGTAGRIGL